MVLKKPCQKCKSKIEEMLFVLLKIQYIEEIRGESESMLSA